MGCGTPTSTLRDLNCALSPRLSDASHLCDSVPRGTGIAHCLGDALLFRISATYLLVRMLVLMFFAIPIMLLAPEILFAKFAHLVQ